MFFYFTHDSAYGVLLYELYEESEPYPELKMKSNVDIQNSILDGNRPFIKNANKYIKDLQYKCLLSDINLRITMEETKENLRNLYYSKQYDSIENAPGLISTYKMRGLIQLIWILLFVVSLIVSVISTSVVSTKKNTNQ